MSHYAASKAALSAYVEGLYREVASLGLRCIAFECGGFPTNLGQPRGPSDAGFGSVKPDIDAYLPTFDALMSKFATNPSAHMPGDVSKAAAAVYDVVKRQNTASSKPWAVRVLLGSDAVGSAEQRCQEQLSLIERWRDVSVSTDRDGANGTVANQEMFCFTTLLE
jgi:NAD(P)-dependent dehydrogenase (short-subunit alcohol dehydrogenase family)